MFVQLIIKGITLLIANKLKDCLDCLKTTKPITREKKYTKKQNKIAEKRQKQNWLRKVGVDGQFEGLEESGLNNGFGQVIPEGGSVWVKICLRKRQGGQQHRSLGDADWDGDGVCDGWEMSTSHGRF